MNAKKSITKGTFIKDLEEFLINNPTAENTTFQEFKSMLWELLCILNSESKYFKKLSNQIGLKYFKNNIGNVQYKIFELLKIENYV